MAGESTRDPRYLSPEALDRLLDTLDRVVSDAIVARAASVENMEVAEAAYESEHDPDPSTLDVDPEAASWPDPQRALRQAQWRLTSRALSDQADVIAELAAWFADVASVAVLALDDATLLSPARAGAGDPSLVLTEEQMGQLTNWLTGERADIFDDAHPDARRTLVWGPEWAEYRVPSLPPASQLSDTLTRHGAPEDLIASVSQARELIADAVAARKRMRLAEEADNEKLLDHADRLTDRLVAYARVLMRCRAAIRSGR